jgi:hypothetical protein
MKRVCDCTEGNRDVIWLILIVLAIAFWFWNDDIDF